MRKLNDGRQADMAEASRFLRSDNPDVRRAAHKTLSILKRGESKEVRDMRQSLIKAHRENNTSEIKDIHEYIKNKSKYHNE